MYATDFEFDGQRLSDYKFIICDFDGHYGVNITESGSKITFEKASHNYGAHNSLISTRYNECITATFDICKDPDYFEPEDMEILSEEYRDIIRWLNRKEFLRFSVIDDKAKENCYYNASFNVQGIKLHEKLYGIRLTLETDAPFGYGNLIEETIDFVPGQSKNLVDQSDEIGFLYPNITIACKSAGNLELINTTFGVNTVINNCSAGETITLLGKEKIISSSLASHKIASDFNYGFVKIGNTYNNRDNIFSSSINCSVKFSYFPIIKDVL